YWNAPEMQVLDDAGHVDGKSRLTAAGAAYDVYPSPAGVVKPAGQWNQVRLVVKGKHVEHWLNGVKMVEYEFGSPDWTAKVKASKFASHPHYGRNATGYIGLQDHGDKVAYRTSRSGCCRERPRQVVCDDVLAVLRLGRLVYVDRRVYDEPRDGETDALALHGEPDRGH